MSDEIELPPVQASWCVGPGNWMFNVLAPVGDYDYNVVKVEPNLWSVIYRQDGGQIVSGGSVLSLHHGKQVAREHAHSILLDLQRMQERIAEPEKVTNGTRWPKGWEVFLISREPRVYEAEGYRLTLVAKSPRWEVRRLADGEVVDNTCWGLRSAIDVVQEDIDERRQAMKDRLVQLVPKRPEVSVNELSTFLYDCEITPTPDTDAETLLAHFEIRRRPEALEAAERAAGQAQVSSVPLTLHEWERLREASETAIRVLKPDPVGDAMEIFDGRKPGGDFVAWDETKAKLAELRAEGNDHA